MNSKRAFTLLELLVTIAVIAVLVALLLPVLSRGKARAKRVACVGNLKQISLGALMYAHENADTLFILSKPSPYPGGTAFFYKELMKSYVGLSGPPAANQLFICPAESASPTDGLYSKAYTVNFSDYAFNAWLTGAKLSAIVLSSLTALVTETPALISYSFHQPQSRYVMVNNPPDAPPYLHAAYNNALDEISYADGHIDYIKIYNDGATISGAYNPPADYDYQWTKN